MERTLRRIYVTEYEKVIIIRACVILSSTSHHRDRAHFEYIRDANITNLWEYVIIISIDCITLHWESNVVGL